MIKLKEYLSLILIFASFSGFAQDEDFAYFAEKYKGNTAVNSLEKTIVTISLDKKKGVSVHVEEESRKIFLKDNAAQFSKDYISFSEHFKLDDLEVYSLIPNGKKYKKEKVSEFSKKTEFSPGIFHNGSESINFFYPSLSKGSVAVANYSKDLSVPQLLGSFYFASYYPTELREIIIHVESGIELDFSYQNAGDEKFKPTIIDTRKGKTYTWKVKDIPSIEIEDDSPTSLYYSPHIIPRITSYESKEGKKQVLGGVQELYDWYYSLVEETDKEASEDLKAIVDSLLVDETDELTKIKKIYYWVQDNIRYVAFEAGMEGFIPDDGSKVCSKRYGDCKGLSSILYTMLNYAGIEAHFTWVGTRNRPYRYEDVPTPIVDDHMILSFKYQDKFYFLDGTSNSNPITEPTAFIQGKEVMIGISKEKYLIETVPIKSSDYTNFNDTLKMRIGENGTLHGNGKVTITGFYASRLKSIMKLTSSEELENFMENYLEKGNNKFELDTFWVSNITDRESDLTINYKFEIKNYCRINGDEIYVNLSMDNIYANKNLKKDRKTPFKVKYKTSFKSVVILEIPETYEVSYFPKPIEFNKTEFGCSMKAQVSGNKLIQEIEEYDNFLLLEKNSFEDWNIMIKNLKKIFRESAILKKV